MRHIEITTKAFNNNRETVRCWVDPTDGEIRVFDDVAEHFTNCHIISARTQALIRRRWADALEGAEVRTDDGNGRILSVDPRALTVTVAWDGEVSTTEPTARLLDWAIA